MVTFPENEIMLKCIYKIVENVKAKNYEGGVFCITGPGLLGSFFIHDYINLRFFFKRDNCSQTICDKDNNDIEILTEYKEYPEEQSKFEKTKHYSILYYEKCIYN